MFILQKLDAQWVGHTLLEAVTDWSENRFEEADQDFFEMVHAPECEPTRSSVYPATAEKNDQGINITQTHGSEVESSDVSSRPVDVANIDLKSIELGAKESAAVDAECAWLKDIVKTEQFDSEEERLSSLTSSSSDDPNKYDELSSLTSEESAQ